jgi:ubiquinone/menaquinone biosynthesis C-methylase UbiE
MKPFLSCTVLSLVWLLPAAGYAQVRPSPSRLFAPEDLSLLDSHDRETWQKPDLIMDALGIADGAIVADLGSGSGWFTVRLARRVGPNGFVYAVDMQQPMIEATERRVEREGFKNVRAILGRPDDPLLPDGSLDAVMIVDTYRDMKRPVALLQNLTRALKPQGRIGIIDYKKVDGGPGPSLRERVDPSTVERDVRTAGLRVIRRETFLPYQFLLIVGK